MKPISTNGFCAGLQVGVDDAVGNGPIVDRPAGGVFGIGVGGSELEARRSVAGRQHEVSANVHRRAAQRGQFADQLLAVLGISEIGFVVAEISEDRLIGAGIVLGVNANRNAVLSESQRGGQQQGQQQGK
jgi:hypothetical protein